MLLSKVISCGCLILKLRYGILLLLCMLAACSNQQTQLTPASEKFALEADIKPYLEQWDNSKEKIASLSSMQEDLLLLIQALSAQTDISTVPKPLKNEVEHIKYGSKQVTKVLPESSQSESTIKAKRQGYSVQIARYMSEKRAEERVRQIKEQYPQLNTILQYHITEQKNKSVTLFYIVAGPVKTQKQAAQLCLFFNYSGNICKLISLNKG